MRTGMHQLTTTIKNLDPGDKILISTNDQITVLPEQRPVDSNRGPLDQLFE